MPTNEIDRNNDGKVSILEWVLWGIDVIKEVVTALISEYKDKKDKE